ncbi:Uncharacterised protein [Segatella copri]|nr:Uncharacterised protein [Segatella copri]
MLIFRFWRLRTSSCTQTFSPGRNTCGISFTRNIGSVSRFCAFLSSFILDHSPQRLSA